MAEIILKGDNYQLVPMEIEGTQDPSESIARSLCSVIISHKIF